MGQKPNPLISDPAWLRTKAKRPNDIPSLWPTLRIETTSDVEI